MPSATFNTNTVPVVMPDRCGEIQFTEEDTDMKLFQNFRCQLDISEDLLVEKSSPEEDEDCVLSIGIAASEVTTPKIRIYSGIEQNVSVKQAQLLVTAVRCILIIMIHDVMLLTIGKTSGDK